MRLSAAGGLRPSHANSIFTRRARHSPFFQFSSSGRALHFSPPSFATSDPFPVPNSFVNAARFSPNQSQYPVMGFLGLLGSLSFLARLPPSFSFFPAAFSALRLPATPPSALNFSRAAW